MVKGSDRGLGGGWLTRCKGHLEAGRPREKGGNIAGKTISQNTSRRGSEGNEIRKGARLQGPIGSALGSKGGYVSGQL